MNTPDNLIKARIASTEKRIQMKEDGVQRSHKSFEEKLKLSPRSATTAIKAKCWECSCEQRDEIRNCVITDCALYNFRPYK